MLRVQGRIVQDDFFTTDPQIYDLVVTIGFIEHSKDLDSAFAPPRLRCAKRSAADRCAELPRCAAAAALGRPLLPRAPQPPGDGSTAVRPIGARYGLAHLAQRYIGGPDPIIVKLGRRWVTPLVLAQARLRRLDAVARFESGLTSPYLITVYRTRQRVWHSTSQGSGCS